MERCTHIRSYVYSAYIIPADSSHLVIRYYNPWVLRVVLYVEDVPTRQYALLNLRKPGGVRVAPGTFPFQVLQVCFSNNHQSVAQWLYVCSRFTAVLIVETCSDYIHTILVTLVLYTPMQ
jgi:hypothetical protein